MPYGCPNASMGLPLRCVHPKKSHPNSAGITRLMLFGIVVPWCRRSLTTGHTVATKVDLKAIAIAGWKTTKSHKKLGKALH